MTVMIVMMMLVNIVYVESATCTVETDTLCVNQINEDGFGDLTNQYAFAMEAFKGKLYVGTLNAVGAPPAMLAFFLGAEFETNGAEIYCGVPNSESCDATWTWTPVVTEGLENPNNYGVRQFAVTDEYLYATTGNHNVDGSGFEIWRSDGTNWEADVGPPASDSLTSGRGLIAWDGYLYVGVEDRASGADIWRRELQSNGDFAAASSWEPITTDGFGHVGNLWFSDFVEYNGYLYAGTLNPLGMELYRTQDGTNWEKIFDRGNGSPFDMAVMQLYVYDDKLYFGTMNFVQGASLWVNSDDEGRIFEPVFTEGNGNRFNSYVWQLEEYNDRLYVGTFNAGGGFDLFSAADPVNDEWTVETLDGFGTGHYGIRSMAVFEDQLIIGSATADESGATKVFAACALTETSDNSDNSDDSDESGSSSYDAAFYSNALHTDANNINSNNKHFVSLHLDENQVWSFYVALIIFTVVNGAMCCYSGACKKNKNDL